MTLLTDGPASIPRSPTPASRNRARRGPRSLGMTPQGTGAVKQGLVMSRQVGINAGAATCLGAWKKSGGKPPHSKKCRRGC